jgi:parallel beta-helix repeat protein
MRILTITFLLAITQVWATNIGGVLSSNTYLDSSNNPYYVTADIQVPTGIELHIGPGVVMFFGEGMSIKVGGLLRMEGTALSPIQLSPDSNSMSWGGLMFYASAIDFDTTNQTGCFVNYIHSVKGGGASGNDIYNFSNGYTIKALLSTVAIKNSIFENNAGLGFLFTQGGFFQYNEVFGNSFSMDHFLGDNTYMYFEDNYIHNINTSYFSAVLTTGKSIINRNIFKECNAYNAILRVSNDCMISDNQITDCPNSWGIILLGGLNHTIYNNAFENNKIHIMQSCERHPIVTNNCFGHFQDYAIFISANIDSFYPFSPYDCLPYNDIVTIDYGDNFFLSTDSLVIQNMIYDYYDNVGDLFICDPYPLSSACAYNNFATETYENDHFFTTFPNPAQDYINIQLAQGFENVTYKMEMINNLGQVVYSGLFDNGFLHLNVSNYSKGLYHLRLSDDKRNLRAVKKIIISH